MKGEFYRSGRAMASYRPFESIGILYTPTEPNPVVVADEVRAPLPMFNYAELIRPGPE